MSEPHYRRIAAEIATRIRDGELRPGDPAPSTRQIVREWGVAMATATKVIGALKADALVTSVPGRGTHVATPAEAERLRPRATPTSQASGAAGDPTRQQVLEAAILIADRDGLELLTMRRLANSLAVSTMSLYRHVATKGDLLLQIADLVFVDTVLPDIPTARWRDRLEAAARIFRDVFLRHPWASGLFSLTRPQVLPNVLALAEWNLQTLRAMGLNVEDMMYAHINLFALVANMSRVSAAEQQAEADTGQTIDAWAEGQAGALQTRAADARLPTFRYVVQHGFDYDLDAMFEFGLQRMLDGIEALLRRVAVDPA